LGRVLQSEPILARPVGRIERGVRWCRRNPQAAVTGVTLCLALGLSLWFLQVVNREKRKQTDLATELRESNRDKKQLLNRTLGFLQENLEGIWANRDKRWMDIQSEDIAALAQEPFVRITNRATLKRWTVGVTVEEDPVGCARQHAKLLSELEDRMSRSLGHEVRLNLRLYKLRNDIVDHICTNQTDFGRIGPMRFLRARRTHSVPIPLVVPRDAYRTGVLFTRSNSGIRSWEDVKGRRVAFGDTNATVSYWAQIKLAEHGITATNLASYDFLESTQDFEDDVQELGFAEAVERLGFMHSHAEVIESVLEGRYDVGVALRKALRVHEHRGLTAIPGTEFESSRPLWVARPKMEQMHVEAMIQAMTNLQGRRLEKAYRAVMPSDFVVEDEWFDRIPKRFPSKSSSPGIQETSSTK
jgi:ABC-type phosphate/phosphonate transport system substrate-binding protein